MAELFLKQGHIRRAIGIYRRMVLFQPGNGQARQRLAELEAAALSQQGGAMSFREHIQRIVESTPGAVACTIMGFDGIAIDTYELPGSNVDISTLLIEFGAAAQQLRRTGNEGGATGELVEMSVTGGKLSAIIRPLTKEYFLAVVLGPNALTGKARFLMRVLAGEIARELS